jgi:flagellum-specific peptidoglycan hydrolase FlgJ
MLANVSKQQQDQYLQSVLPAARIASSKTGIAPELIASFWSWETHWGTNETAKVNNHGGIKANTLGKDFIAGQYAGYNSIERFAEDWGRVLNLNYYTSVLQADQSNWTEVVTRFNASPYAEDSYNTQTIINRANRARELQGQAINVTTDSQSDLANLGAAFLGLLAAASLLQKK